MLFLPSILLAVCAAATAIPLTPRPPSLVTLPIARRFNLTGTSTILQRDQARAAALRNRNNFAHTDGRKRAVINQAVDNVAVVYSATIGIGSPATQYDLLIDTGSSNTWVGAGRSYVRTSTSVDTGFGVSVTYGSGFFDGEEFLDQVTITPELVIQNQSIGVASDSSGFDGFDGILGIGPVILTQGTLSGTDDPNEEIPTVTDNLFAAGALDENLIGISFNPTSSLEVVNGELTWGGIDSSKFTGELNFAPVTQTSPSTFFWGIDQTITYGTTTILSSNAGIVDTGTTLILLATDAFNRYVRATGAVEDIFVGLLRITNAQFSALQPLVFNVGGVAYSLPPNGQLWPRALNTAIGGNRNSIYLIVADLGSNSGEGFDFVNGYTFLERFYSVFDTTNNQVGFATTANTNSNTN